MARKKRSRFCEVCAASPSIGQCARPGSDALDSEARGVIDGKQEIGCSVPMDRCCKHGRHRDSRRWDYLLILRADRKKGIGLEVHHAAADQIDVMIDKKRWAEDLLAAECPDLDILRWCWIIPEGSVTYLPHNDPGIRRLAMEGISRPMPRLVLV